jgi:phage shock protein A
LEDCKTALGEEKDSLEQEISDVETQLKELKAKHETAKNQQPTGQ